MKLKGLTQKDVQRMSGGRITDGYVASITTGRAKNLSVDKLKALADGLGVDVDALFEEGDGYFGIAKDSLSIHVAAWRANHATVKLLIERGSPIEVRDGKGRTPLALAVRACVDSYWAYRRSPESVEALLHAGASTSGVTFPSGYAEVDELLRRHAREG